MFCISSSSYFVKKKGFFPTSSYSNNQTFKAIHHPATSCMQSLPSAEKGGIHKIVCYIGYYLG